MTEFDHGKVVTHSTGGRGLNVHEDGVSTAEASRLGDPVHASTHGDAAAGPVPSTSTGTVLGQHARDAGEDERSGKRAKAHSLNRSLSPATRLPASGAVLPAPRRRKGQRLGRLEAVLQEMPVEILGEILSQLTPNMLLRLARMAKVFRQLLMTRASRSIWRRSFANDGITGLVNDQICEPLLASLIWDKECESDFSLKTPNQLRSELNLTGVPDIFDCVPCITSPPCRGGHWSHFEGVPLKLYVESAFKTELQRILDLNDEPAVDGGPSERSSYIEKRKGLIELMQQDAATLQSWQAEVDTHRVGTKAQLRRERIKCIRNKCLDQGYEEQDIERVFDKDGHVRSKIDQPYALTDRVWRKISVSIFEELTRVREARLAEQRKRLEDETLSRIKTDQERQISLQRFNNLNRVAPGNSFTVQQRPQMQVNIDQRMLNCESGRLQAAHSTLWERFSSPSQTMHVSAPTSQAMLMPTSSSMTPNGNLDVLSTISTMLRDRRPIRFAHPLVPQANSGLSMMPEINFGRFAQPSAVATSNNSGHRVTATNLPLQQPQPQQQPAIHVQPIVGWPWPVQQTQQQQQQPPPPPPSSSQNPAGSR
ncbi:hypothetical protein OIV83_003956 [Microbotryomycetes sp. JL201]|nr:hypothetical protein OIV83_003956 [Microbotryomycetes sp. JL201]